MRNSHLRASVLTRFAALVAVVAAGATCRAAVVNFITDNGEFSAASSWSDGNAPTADFDSHFIQDNLTARVTSGASSVFFLTVGDTSLGRLALSGGSLTVTGENRLEVGRSIGGEGQITLSGSTTLTADGAIIGTRAKATLSVGPDAILDLKDVEGGTRDMRVGSYGPGYNDGGLEPGLNGDGLVEIHGTLNAASIILSQSGGKGELRLVNGTINLSNRLWMDLCEGCGNSDLRTSKVSIVGSAGTFTVGGGDLRATSPTAMFSFTADAGGVTPIVAASAAEIDTAKLELNLDAFPFTPTSKLTLIDAIPSLLVGEFGTITFLGGTTADVNYDLLNGDVYLDNFQSVAIPADFDLDGDVDGADFLTWQRGFGITGTATVAQGDADGNHNVDAADLAIWKQNFGTGSAVPAIGAVPEPSGWLLAVLPSVALAILRRRP